MWLFFTVFRFLKRLWGCTPVPNGAQPTLTSSEQKSSGTAPSRQEATRDPSHGKEAFRLCWKSSSAMKGSEIGRNHRKLLRWASMQDNQAPLAVAAAAGKVMEH
jgi:hypothetical protein